MKRIIAPLLCVAAAPALAQAPPGYVKVYSDVPGTESDIANGLNYTGGMANWFYNVEQCCGGDPNRPLSIYSVIPAGETGPTYPFLFTRSAFEIQLKLHPANGSNPNGYWTSGILTSLDTSHAYGHSWTYGYFEWTAQMPGTLSPPTYGTWPGFYLKSVDQSDMGGFEIDVLEHYGEFPQGYSTNIHDYERHVDPGGCNVSVAPADLTAGKHKFGMLWTATSIQFFFDGTQVCNSYSPTSPSFQTPAYVIMDMGVGGSMVNDPGANPPKSSVLKITNFSVYEPQ